MSNSDSQLNLMSKAQLKTIKRLETLKKLATKFKDTSTKSKEETKILDQLNSTQSLTTAQNCCVVHTKAMQMFVLDISGLFPTAKIVSDNLKAKWQTPIAPHFFHAPNDTILYSLSKGIDEIILFGGMELMDSPLYHIKPSYEQMKQKISNKLFIMKPSDLNSTLN
jgi:hypothetical protein